MICLSVTSLCVTDSRFMHITTNDPEIPWLGTYPEKVIIQKDVCTSIFITALFTIARTWKQPKCLPTSRMDKRAIVHIENGILLSQKKELNSAICRVADGPRNGHKEWSQREKNKCHVVSLICGV